MDAEDIDFALVAWREDGRWQVERLAPKVADHLDGQGRIAERARPRLRLREVRTGQREGVERVVDVLGDVLPARL